MPRVLFVADVPDTYKPKAGFALKTMLSAFFRYEELQLTGVLAAEQSPDDCIRIYYGPDARAKSGQFDCSILMAEDAPAFFEQEGVRKASDVFYPRKYPELPVLFGRGEEASSDKPANLITWDVVASAFYFLSDWEGMLPGRPRDAHGRLPFKGSLMQQLDLAGRAVVNEYADILAGCITSSKSLDIKPKAYGGHAFAACITHDLDRIQKRYPGTYVRELFEIPVLNPHGYSAETRLRRFRKTIADLLQPGDGYERSILGMFALEQELGIRPTVLVKSILHKHKNDAADYLSYPLFSSILESVKKLGGELGLHASYEAGYLEPLFHEECRKLEARIAAPVRSHRFHYLRYEPTRLTRLLASAGILTDSSVGWAERTGFRTGFTHPYFLYDLKRNAAGPVLEIPLPMMEMHLLHRMALSPEQALKHACLQVELVKKHGGVLCWDFHHHALDDAELEGAGFLFEQALRYLHHQNPIYLTMSQVYETI